MEVYDMMVMRLAADCYIELPAGVICRGDGDDFLCCDESGRIVARTERQKVMAYGNAQTLRLRYSDPEAANLETLYNRYEKARSRYLGLEAELHHALTEVEHARTARARVRLESLGLEVAKVHDRDYAPYRAHLLKTLATEPVLA
jgi:hypothetical protein